MTTAYWIQALGLAPHPEGGYFRETYRSYALVGGTASPGFDFADFELADRATLLAAVPQHREAVLRLTH